MVGVSLSSLVVDYITLSPWQRFNDDNLYGAMGEHLWSEVNNVFDSIDSYYDASKMTFTAVDPEDQYLLTVSNAMLSAPMSDPISINTTINILVPIFKEIYANLIIPDDLDIHSEWDYELEMINGDTAVVLFMEKENVDFLKTMLG